MTRFRFTRPSILERRRSALLQLVESLDHAIRKAHDSRDARVVVGRPPVDVEGAAEVLREGRRCLDRIVALGRCVQASADGGVEVGPREPFEFVWGKIVDPVERMLVRHVHTLLRVLEAAQ